MISSFDLVNCFDCFFRVCLAYDNLFVDRSTHAQLFTLSLPSVLVLSPVFQDTVKPHYLLMHPAQPGFHDCPGFLVHDLSQKFKLDTDAQSQGLCDVTI